MENSNYPKASIKQVETTIFNSNYRDAELAYAELYLSSLKEKNKEITIDDIYKIMRNNNLSYKYTFNIINSIITNPLRINFQKILREVE